MVLQTKNESKARRYKNLVLKKMPFDFQLIKSEPFYKDDSQWFLELKTRFEDEDALNITYLLNASMTLIFERFEASGPIIDEDTGEFMALCASHYRKRYGAKVHHCIEEFHVMVSKLSE